MKYVNGWLVASVAFAAAWQIVCSASGGRRAVIVHSHLGLAHSGWPTDRGDAANTGRGRGRTASGRLKWVFRGNKPAGEPILGPNHTIYAGSSASVIYCLSQRDGRERHGFESGVRRMDAQEDKAALHARIYDYVPYRGQHGAYGIPVVGRSGLVYVGSDNNKFYAVDATSGRKIWAFKLGNNGTVASATIGGDGTVYFGSDNHDIYALNGTTGKLRWKYQTGDYVENTPALSPDGTLYVGSRDTFLYALSCRSGKLRWKFQTSDVIYSAAALGSGGVAYAACRNGYVYALDALSGRRLWSERLRGEIFDSPGLSEGGTVYIVVAARASVCVYALDGRTGHQRWVAPMHPVGGSGTSSIAIAGDGTVYAATDRLYALSGRTGKTRWVFNAHSLISSPAVGLDGTVYFVTLNGSLYAVQ